ncbi:ComF family protein [Pseudobutyrivibrio xylanivorans]|uniref:ComF family protein n=1 Tax=Pseudobutyrivibrio xylanivorans DSM 14809 TaxID=1123012 RepID=A0A1M6GYC0_PSEXY|nr:ComF family protein [Pseudobutyrivibrio xylanivorans]SHJ14953.1 comF family protein [Pseudobutyrivibrio xylanivorans DSM 14809]
MYLHIKGIIAPLLGVLYPKRCVACDKVLLKIEKEMGFCASCSKKVKLVGPVFCMKCGTPLADDRVEYCKDCQGATRAFIQNRAIYQYAGDMKDAMYRFKYGNRRCYAMTFAAHALHYYRNWINEKGIEAIVPVPMYKPKEKRRGYNQAAVFAQALSQVTGIPVAEEIVQRDKDTEAMKQLNALKRKKNLLKAFSLTKNDVQFRKVLLVDDIYTTGTTMDEVAKVLKQGGIDQVYGMCVCIGEVQ